MNVAIYTRVSTEDQKENGFSLADQERKLRAHCKGLNKKVIAHYQDNCSAKDFNRPQFQKMLSELRSKKLGIDELWCIRPDRFSRNFMETYRMREVFKSFKVEIRFVENEVDLSIPENLMIDAVFNILPQVENERRGLNTSMGMRQAMREGRWPWKAPKGYNNNKATKIIEPNNDAQFILRAFNEVSRNQRPIDHIRQDLVKDGFKCSKQSFYDLLRKPIYMGKIRIDAYREESEELVDGKHEAIIPERLFREVQAIINSNTKKSPKHKNSDSLFPLRGYLVCNTCGNKLTASKSKGRSKYYNYYHCQNGCKERHSADKVESNFIELLDSIQIPGPVMRLYHRIVKDVFETKDGKKEDQVNQKEKEITKLKNNRDYLDEQLINGALPIDDYRRMVDNIKIRIKKKLEEIEVLEADQSDLDLYFDRSLYLLSHLKEHFINASIGVKRQIVGSIFPGKLIFDGKNYRTGKINSVVNLITSKNWDSQRLGNKKATISGGLSNLAPPLGLEPRTL